MIHIASLLQELPRVGSRDLADRIALARKRGIDVLELAPYPYRDPANHIVEAAAKAVIGNEETPSRGTLDLRSAIAAQVGLELGRSIDPTHQVIVTNGAMQALNITFRTILDPGDEVIIPTPCYYFQGCVALAGGVARYVPMQETKGYRWEIEPLEAAITPRTRALVVNTPTNPTGHMLTAREIEELASMALRHNLIIVADESYDRLVFDGRTHLSIAAIPEVAEQTILIKSLTKSYAMPAWRVGYLVAPEAFVEAATRTIEWELLHCNHVAQAAAAAAIRGPQEHLLNMALEFQRARDQLLAGLVEYDEISCLPPQGGPFLFLNIQRIFTSSQAASDALLEVGVPTVPGWYCQSDAHIRMGMGASPSQLDEVVRRIGLAVHTYQHR
jgi:aminotransferase